MLPSGLPDHVDGDEDLARFLNSSRYFRVDGSLQGKAFLPDDGETSVFRHGREPRKALWAIGRTTIVEGRNLHGAAIFKAGIVRAVGLDVAAEEPPPRHANIVGWPTNPDPRIERAAQLEWADLIAAGAELVQP